MPIEVVELALSKMEMSDRCFISDLLKMLTERDRSFSDAMETIAEFHRLVKEEHELRLLDAAALSRLPPNWPWSR